LKSKDKILLSSVEPIGAKFTERKNIAKFVIILSLFSWITSCVPNKKLTYLQYGDDLKELSPTDTVLRKYDLKKKTYFLQPNDIISIRVASITDDEFNFIKKYESDLGLIRKLDQYNRNIEDEGGQGNNFNNRMMMGGGVNSADGQISSIMLDRLNTGFTLDANGELELPEIGVLDLGGLTIPEAEMKVKQALEGYYEVPMVRIQLLNYHFTVLGEVESEGRYTSFDPTLTIFDAISLAGNIGEFADRSNIKIIRQEEGEARVLYLNMLDETTLKADNFYVQRDDIIVVPALKARTTTQYTLKNVGFVLGITTAVLSITALIISLSR
jgi:polysaccharide export outer membrane protein